MQQVRLFLAGAAIAALAACGQNAADDKADQVEAEYEQQADMLEERADTMDDMGNDAEAEALEEQAEQIEDTGEAVSEDMEETDAPADGGAEDSEY